MTTIRKRAHNLALAIFLVLGLFAGASAAQAGILGDIGGHIKDVGKAIGSEVKGTAKIVGRGAKKVGGHVKDVGKAIGREAKETGKIVGKGAKDWATSVGSGAKDIGIGIGKGAAFIPCKIAGSCEFKAPGLDLGPKPDRVSARPGTAKALKASGPSSRIANQPSARRASSKQDASRTRARIGSKIGAKAGKSFNRVKSSFGNTRGRTQFRASQARVRDSRGNRGSGFGRSRRR